MPGQLPYRFLGAISALLLFAAAALGDPITGTVLGGFVAADPEHFRLAIEHGNVIDPVSPDTPHGILPTLGYSSPFFNNGSYNVNGIPGTSTAVSTPSGNSVSWGGSSSLSFTGYSLNNAQEGVPVALGKFTFFNGSSELNALIFGLKMVLDVGASNDPNVEPLTLNIGIGTTVNYGNVGINDQDWDADFVSIVQGINLGAPPGIVDLALASGTSLHAFEGQSATAEIYGVFYGDPQFVLTQMQIIPNDDGTIGGFVGNGPIGPFVPEPGSFTLLTMATLSIVGGVWRCRRKTAALVL